MVLVIKWRSRRHVSQRLRDELALNSLDRTNIKLITKSIKYCGIVIKNVRESLQTSVITELHRQRLLKAEKSMKIMMVKSYVHLLSIIVADVPEFLLRRSPRTLYQPHTFDSMKIHLENNRKTVSDSFRFQSFEKMHKFLDCYCFPRGIIEINRYKFTAQEILMISLKRLSFPSKWTDLYEFFPGRKSWSMSLAFHWFLDFMITNWAYLFLNNLPFWLPYLHASAEAIRLRLANLPYANWNQEHLPAGTPGGFNICGFIDDTLMAMSRPGGFNEENGRALLELQQAVWTGYKRLHGLKFQTIILANGMDLDVFGPESVRQNDLKVLDLSDFVFRFQEVQIHQEFKYKIFGDSAFKIQNYPRPSLRKRI